MGILDGKIAIVTGAGQGVGQGIAFALAGEGARIAVAGRTESKLVVTCEEIERRGGVGIPVTCDVTSGEQIDACVNKTVEAFSTIDILVNNAQMVPLGALNDVTEESLQDGWDSGPLAAFRFMKACYPYLKGGGSIVNVASSVSLRWDMSRYGAYAAVKEGIRCLSRAAASEWGPEDIRVNVIMPHALSPALAWWTENNPEEAAEFVKTIPLGRIGDCERDIGRGVVFLVGPDAGYVTGSTLMLDGGQAFLR